MEVLKTKDNFLLKRSQREVFDTLTDEQAGILIKGIFKYLDTNDSELTGMLKAIFIPIKKDIDKNEEKYQMICERNKKNGTSGGRPKIEQKSEENLEKKEKPKKTQKNPVGYFGKNTHISYIHNNINNKVISNNRGMGEEEKEEKEEEEVASEVGLLTETTKKIIDYLNLKANTKFRCSSKATQTKIIARLNEGYKLDDFIVVINKKSDEWIGTEFEQYLCPETLFGTKFEKYLNQKVKVVNKKKSEKLPEWYDKKIEEKELTEEEAKEMKKILEEITK